MHVLLIDDHPVIHETLRAMVRSLRPAAEVHSQFDLEAGLREARSLTGLELVLLDLGLPGCAGLDALQKLREALPHARVAVISADDEAVRVRAALDAGAVGFLPKTLRPRAMVEALRSMLDGGTYAPH